MHEFCLEGRRKQLHMTAPADLRRLVGPDGTSREPASFRALLCYLLYVLCYLCILLHSMCSTAKIPCRVDSALRLEPSECVFCGVGSWQVANTFARSCCLLCESARHLFTGFAQIRGSDVSVEEDSGWETAVTSRPVL